MGEGGEEAEETGFIVSPRVRARSRQGSQLSEEPSLPPLTRSLYHKFLKQFAEGMAFMHAKGASKAWRRHYKSECNGIPPDGHGDFCYNPLNDELGWESTDDESQ